jgi:hypothetical protein
MYIFFNLQSYRNNYKNGTEHSGLLRARARARVCVYIYILRNLFTDIQQGISWYEKSKVSLRMQ